MIDALTSAGAAVHVLCFTRGEASTINATGADLRDARAEELRQASAELGVTGCALLAYPDAALHGVSLAELEARVAELAARHRADGLLVVDETGVTGHADHKAARLRLSQRPRRRPCRRWPGPSRRLSPPSFGRRPARRLPAG